MNKVFLSVLLTSAALQTAAHDAEHNPLGLKKLPINLASVSSIYHAGYGDTFGTEAYPRTGRPQLTQANGLECVQASNLLLDIDDSAFFDIANGAQLSLTFKADTAMRIQLGYDAVGKAEQLQWIELSKSENLQTVTLKLDDARFINRGLSSTDIALISENSVTATDTPDNTHTFTLCDIKIEATNLQSSTKTTQFSFTADNQSTPVRLGIYSTIDGRKALPSDDAIDLFHYSEPKKQHYIRSLWESNDPWPHANRYFIYAPSNYTVNLAKGEYVLVASKGPEYPIIKKVIKVTDKDNDFVINFERTNHIENWYSGDGHIHMLRDSPKHNQNIAAIATAEGLSVFNLLQMGNLKREYFQQYAFGKEGQFTNGTSHLVSGVENPRTAVRGHTISHNIKRSLYNRDRYFNYLEQFKGYQKQGGLTGYAHVGQGWYNEQRGLAIDVALGAIDFVEIMQNGQIKTELWYDFLNLGFKLAPMAGSDYPYIDSPGSVRVYAKVDGEFTTDKWFSSIEQGTSFVTNGPLIKFSIGDAIPGNTIETSKPVTKNLRLYVSIEPTIDQLKQAQLIINGQIIDTFYADDKGQIRVDQPITIDGPSWIAVKVEGEQQSLAHTGAIYVNYNDQGHGLTDKSAVAKRMLSYLDQLNEPAYAGAELEYVDIATLIGQAWQDQRPLLDKQIEQAKQVYQSLIDK